MLSPFGNQPGQKNVARVIFAARVTLCCVFLWSMTWSTGKAQTDATWTGNGVTQNYSELDNWLDGVVPVNEIGATYNVTIPNSKTVLFDMDGSSDVTDLTLGTDSTLTIEPGKQLNVLNDARISGLITTIGGTFNAPGVGAQLLDNQARLITSGTGQIVVGALSCSLTRSGASLTLLSADGQDSLLDLSAAQSFTSASSAWGVNYYDVVVSNKGVIDLSKVQSIAGAVSDDWLRLTLETGGDIRLPSVTAITGRTKFVVDVDDYSLPALETAVNTYFDVKRGRTLNLPELLSMADATVSIAAAGTLDAPKLKAFTNSSITRGANQTFNHGVITDVNYSELHVRDGATWTLDAVESYDNTFSGGSLTLLSADGPGSLLDLSSVRSFTSASSLSGGVRYYDVVVSNDGVIDLSSVQSIAGAVSDDWLRLTLETGGDIRLPSVTAITGRTKFVVDVDDYSLPALDTAVNTYFDVKWGRTLNLPELLSMADATVSIAAHGKLDAPKLKAFTNSSITRGANQTFNHGVITDVNYSELHVRDGVTWTLDAVESYDNTFSGGSLTLLSADGPGSLLDLSSVRSFKSASSLSGGVRYYDVVVSNDGVIDLSSVQSIAGAVSDDWLRLIIQSDGNIPLTALTATSGRTKFIVDVDNYSLPALDTAADTYFDVKWGRTLNLPELLSMADATVSIAAHGKLDAPKLKAFTNSSITRGANQTFNHGVITDVNYSELHVRDGVTWTLDAVESYDNTFSGGSLTLLSADGPGSLLDLSSVRSFKSASSLSGGVRYYDVVVSNDGVIDLSSVQSIAGAVSDDWLRLIIQSDGNIPLTALTATSGRTKFIVDVDNYSLPALDTAADTYFDVKPGRTLNLPELVSMLGSGGGINIQNTATLNAGELLSMAGAAVSIAADGTLDAPRLKAFTNSSITRGANQTFNHGVITDVNYSELHVRDGVTWTLDAVESYDNTFNSGSLTLLSADGQDSLLDLSSVRSFKSASSGSGGVRYYDVVVSNDGVIDLSKVQSIAGAVSDDWVRFKMDSGGQLLLPSLRSITNRVKFEVGSDGVLALGDVAITQTTEFNVNHPGADVTVGGSLYLDGASQLSMVSGASLKVEGDLLYAYTSESKLATDTAVLYMNGYDIQWLEVGGEDLGLTGSSSGNFGFGRLVIGQEGQPTTVMPLDLFDNGYRGPGTHEALYLYGVGGMEGLELLGGSTLILDGINVYAQQHEGWVHLNDLFDPGVTKISFSGGMIVVPEPSTFVLLGVAALIFSLLRFRRRLK